LSHNSRNKPDVRKLKARLVAEGLTVWLDEDELRPGISVQKSLEAGIRSSKTIVVVVGADGIGPWEDKEIRGALQLAANDDLPIIPVLLPGCPEEPELPLFLSDFKWVDLRDGLNDAGVGKLFWGITGKKSGGANVGRVDDDSIPEPPERSGPTVVRGPNNGPVVPPPQLTLNQILPGRWQVHIQVMYPPGVTGQLNVELLPNGMFNGQVMSPMGWGSVSGQWQANPLTNQIGLQGMQTDGYQTMPYVVMVQVNYFDAQRITGVSNVGEQLTWQRTA
jgi:hypothetical protein